MGKRTAAPACWACAALLGLAASCSSAESTERGKGGAAQAGVQRAAVDRLRGKVSSVQPSGVVIEDAEGRWFHLQLAPETIVRKGGQPSSMLDLKEGVELEALYVRENGGLRALELDVAGSQ
jgi:hypothetical protein